MCESRKLRQGYHDNVAFLFDFVMKEFWPVGVQGQSDRKRSDNIVFCHLFILQRIICLL